jgi:hypothetical protein
VDWTFNNTQSAKLAFRSGNQPDLSDSRSWEQIANVDKGTDLDNVASCGNTDKYVQYRISFSTDDISETPSIEDVTINYENYTHKEELISSPFNTTFLTNRIMNLTWNKEETSSDTDIRFLLRTAPDNNGSPGAWSSWF